MSTLWQTDLYGEPFVSELIQATFNLNAAISILRWGINCLELDFITSVFCPFLFILALNDTPVAFYNLTTFSTLITFLPCCIF